jgi:hypothetical protein
MSADGIRFAPLSAQQIALDEFNNRLLDILLPELERWKVDPLIPTMGIAGDICEALRASGLLRSHLQ